MAKKIMDVVVPDIGGAEDVGVIEILVAVGDRVKVEDPLLTLESDKATMDLPSPAEGVIESLQIEVGGTVSEGDVVMKLALSDAPADKAPVAKKNAKQADAGSSGKEAVSDKGDNTGSDVKQAAADSPKEVAVSIPDIGGADEVAIIEISVKVGDEVAAEDPLLTLESDKATMEVPAPFAGKIISVGCAVGDKVSEGSVIMQMQVAGTVAATSTASAASALPDDSSADLPAQAIFDDVGGDVAGLDWDDDETAIVEPNFYAAVNVYAGPAVRRLARELGVDLTLIKKKTGAKGRITKGDLKNYVKDRMQQGGSGLGVTPAPAIDFSKFGEVEQVELSRIQKLTGSFLHRNWVTIPHVTQFADADITDLEAFRKDKKAQAQAEGIRLTPLAFIMKAVEAALLKFPKFNSSLAADGQSLFVKKYINIGVAMDTEQGLVVGVVRDVNEKGVFQLAKELADMSAKARDKGLSPADMQGGCITISSLGGIGGTAFTPIVNAPEVAILGVSRSQQQPVYQADTKQFAPRLMLPLCLSYDHRVIDGADGARFIMYLTECLTDLENLIL